MALCRRVFRDSLPQPTTTGHRIRPRKLKLVARSATEAADVADKPAAQTSSAQAISPFKQLARDYPTAVASAAVFTLSAVAGSTYKLLSSPNVSLPPLDILPEVAASTAAAGVGAVGMAKLIMGDKFHLEFHKGRLYVQTGVPSNGPAVPAGCIVTQPTGDVRGNGAYATSVIPAGSHIADYSGDYLDREAFYRRYPAGYGDYAMAVDQEYVIDAVSCVCCTSTFHPVHMNHSRTRANVKRFYNRREGRVSFFALRDIQPGEELLYNYGRDYWIGREHLELP